MNQTLDRPVPAPEETPPPDRTDVPPRDADDTPSTDARLAELERGFGRRDTWTLSVLAIAAVVMIASIIAIGFAQRREGAAAPVGAGQTITASLTEFGVALSADEVSPNSTITVTNEGAIDHTLGVTDTDVITPLLGPGESATLDLSGLDPGDYELFCDVPGHASSGMTAPLTIGAGAAAPATPAAADAAADMGMSHEEHAAMTEEEAQVMDQAMVESVLAFPAETAGVGNQPLEPTVLADGTKHFELTASIIEWEVSPGKVVEGWAYNGQIPGPRIDVEVGDDVEIALTNELPLGTDIHLHGIDVPLSEDGVAPITQDLVPAGGTFTYRFTAREPAIGMYHAHAHGEQSVPNGLLGTIYVGEIQPPAGRTISGIEIPADLTVAQDVPMVVNDAGTIGLTLNGKSFPATAPIVVAEGDWVTMTYFNEGMQTHPMHLHGFEQIVYAKDGEPLDHPYAADTINVAPGERYSVLFHADQAGTWVFHCHILNHVESDTGMFGMVTAVIVE